jgi:hypothetical protein
MIKLRIIRMEENHMGYVVFEDLQSEKYLTILSDTPVKIHAVSCRFYINRGVNPTTVRWFGPFDTIEKAEIFAKQLGKSWKRAQCCP